ncbi:uncharacterized protein LOC105795555 [Gossypium raimondii]|uniref:RNase H type-1 domain-containing protein n=1 Tax=Gossypium hirsutum TaxID=3635 RepID=A0A1U8PQF5_GOSHI|nr:uncharacterized protein LOC105795555 [Gossypium raimondii]XP_016752583.1 uncharacterized protein LOC107960818 [Gossypium hirsutum]
MAELNGLEERTLTSDVDRRQRQHEGNTRVAIYFDAAFDGRFSKSASGLVARGLMGEILASMTVLHTAMLSPFMSEAHAGLQAVKLGISMGFNSIEIVGDSRMVIQKCKSTASDKSVIGAIIRDIQSKKDHFQEINFQFVQRSGNGCAHELAKEALKRGEEQYLEGAVIVYNRREQEERWPRHPD